MTRSRDRSLGSCCEDGLLCVGDNDVARALVAAGFAALWRNTALTPSQLVRTAAELASQVAAALARRGRAELDAQGRLVGIHGLTLRTTRHHLVHAGHRHWTWCAFDAIGIPAALGIHAVAHTDCPTCREPITVAIARGAPVEHSAVLWLPASSGTNLMADFCAQADLYCNAEHLEQRLDPAVTPGRVLDIAAGADLGRLTWADVADVEAPEP